ncbi:hypothetical protein STVA_13650 [Allostella vacuolata]|nr:hypothetical protein STVA_13650 [Stella vacuolata]
MADYITPLLPKQIQSIQSFQVTGPTSLHIQWKAGGSIDVDLVGWIARGQPTLNPLRDAATFAAARIIDYGGAIAWDEDEEMVIDSLHLEILATPQKPMTAGDMRVWQEQLGISNREASDLLGIAQSTWNAYKAGTADPTKAVQIACRALAQDPTLMNALFRPAPSVGRPKAARPEGDRRTLDEKVVEVFGDIPVSRRA